MINEPPRRRRRQLNEAERVLWREVTRGIRPLSGRLEPEPGQDNSGLEAVPADAAPSGARPQLQPASGPAKPDTPAARRPPPLAPLGRRMRQRLVRSRREIAGRIDLHGLTQREAHDALLGFLRTAQGRGAGIVLVITGKGGLTRGAGGREGREIGDFAGLEGHGGVLRRQVPQWLRLPEFRDLIVGFETAHAAHGGEGAMYVQVRRRRE